MFARIVLIISVSFFAVSAPGQDCSPPPIVANLRVENSFTPQQEMDLGDAIAERIEKDYRVIDDAAVNAHLQRIADRILKHIPGNQIKMSFVVADLPDTNAFAMVGGRIFVTRKLISFVRSEDELAGVIAHEIGHASVRHGAIDYTKRFKQILGVTQFGDRADIFDKYNQYIEKRLTKNVKFASNHEDGQQLEADRVAIFALAAAGYDPNVFTGFWTRLTNAKKSGFLGEIFGGAKPADKRLREMVDAIKSISPQCIEKRAADTAEFDKWRKFVINFSGLNTKESLSGLISRRELVPLRSDIEHLKFSPDGKHLLAQDSASVTVLTREPFAIVFRIEAEDAQRAAFTPDSKTILVYDEKLRVQNWDIQSKSLTSVNDVAIPRGFWQTRLSPDGSVLACYQYNGDLVLYDVATNEPIFKEKQFYLPTYFEYFFWSILRNATDASEVGVFNMKFSPDGRYFIAGRNVSAGLQSRQETIGIDLSTKTKFGLGENIKRLLYHNLAFVSADKVVGQYGSDIAKSGIFTFPSGERVDQFELSGVSFATAERGDYVLVRPVNGAAVGVYDTKAKKYVVANKKAALDIFENTFVAERRNGELALYEVSRNEPKAVLELPPSPFGNLRTTSLSHDGKWLAASEKSRGAIWNLATGERVMHTRAYHGSYFAPDGQVYADFPKMGSTDRTIAKIDVNGAAISPVSPLTDDNARQIGPYLVVRKPIKQKGESAQNVQRPADEQQHERRLASSETIFEIRDARTGSSLWTRQFDTETPSYSLSAPNDTMVLYWPLRSKAARAIVATSPELSAKVGTMEDKEGDYLFQVIDPKTGARRGQVLFESGDGSIQIEGVTAAGDYLVVRDDENRILVYSISSGRLIRRFFGNRAIVSLAAGVIAVENFTGKVTVYELASGKEIDRLLFRKPVSMMQFVDDRKQLFVLTADQIAYTFDAMRFGTKRAD